MSHNNLKTILILILAVLFAAAMLIFSEDTESATKTAIIMWANSIVPVLLPFFIFSEFIKRTGILKSLPPQIYAFVVAFLSGYPMGAKVVGDFVKEKSLTVEEGRYILSYSLVTGPAFILFTIGEFIGSKDGAIVVAVAHYLGVFLNSRLYKCPLKKHRQQNGQLNNQYLDIFTASISSGFKAMAVILAYLMFFSIAVNMVEMTGILDIIDDETFPAVLKGVLEMTIGINMVGLCDIGIGFKAVLASMLVSFGGLSVIGQSASMTHGSGIGFKDILKIKITHGMGAAIVATLITRFVVI